MKEVLEKGVVEILFPESSGGGLTGETHLVTYDEKKYVLRKCDSISKAKYYEELSGKFERYNFLPKFLGRIGKNVFYEYIDGRDLRSKRERLENIRQVGKILSKINGFDFEGVNVDHTRTFLNGLESGKYKSIGKVAIARKKRGIRGRPKKVLSQDKKKNILWVLDGLRKELELRIVYECTDPTSGNFRIREGKVYLVDIDSIKPKHKGIGISKFFLEWGNTRGKREKFIEGYGKENMKFFNSRYKDFMDLTFLIQRVWFEIQTGKDYEVSLRKLERLVKNLNRIVS